MHHPENYKTDQNEIESIDTSCESHPSTKTKANAKMSLKYVPEIQQEFLQIYFTWENTEMK